MEITKQMEMVLYHSEQSDVTVNAIIKDETIWITQKAMAELFGIDKSGISRHLSNIFKSGELDEKVVVAKIAIPTKHGAIPEKSSFLQQITVVPLRIYFVASLCLFTQVKTSL